MGGKCKKEGRRHEEAGGDGCAGEPARRCLHSAPSSRLPNREKQPVHQESPPGPRGPHGAQPHLRCCSISARFSCSSLKAEARLSSSRSASVAIPVPAGCRLGRVPLKECVFLLELPKVFSQIPNKTLR